MFFLPVTSAVATHQCKNLLSCCHFINDNRIKIKRFEHISVEQDNSTVLGYSSSETSSSSKVYIIDENVEYIEVGDISIRDSAIMQEYALTANVNVHSAIERLENDTCTVANNNDAIEVIPAEDDLGICNP